MSGYEVPNPILNSPLQEPAEHWNIVEGEEPQRLPGRRPAMYFYRDPAGSPTASAARRARPSSWSWSTAFAGRCRPGATRATRRVADDPRPAAMVAADGRQRPLFFAQIEAAETIIFLVESRADFRQGLNIPSEEPGPDKLAQGYATFSRYACKMATGTGKTTVMGMIAAWSILNKVNDRGNARFSDVVLVVCPNVTIRRRLAEFDPAAGPASIYVTRDLVPPDMRYDLTRGRVLVTNWHVFEPRGTRSGGTSAKVNKAGVPLRTREKITIGPKTTTARGSRYLTQADFDRQVAAGLIEVLEEERDKDGTLKKVLVESVRYVESDTALINRGRWAASRTSWS